MGNPGQQHFSSRFNLTSILEVHWLVARKKELDDYMRFSTQQLDVALPSYTG